ARARAGEERRGRRGLALGLLAEQPVAQLVAALVAERGADAVRAAADRVERVVGAGAHRVGVQLQQARELVVAASLAQQQLQDGLLIGGKRVELAHAARQATRAARYRAAPDE